MAPWHLSTAVWFALAAALLAGGCATPPAETRPEATVPTRWQSTAVLSRTLADVSYGALVEDALLESLVKEALEYNSDLRIAAERVALARAQYLATDSSRYPTIAGGAQYTRQRSPGSDPNRNSTSGLGQVAISLPAWEIDVWGRLASMSEADRQRYLASEATQRAIAIALIGSVGESYVQLVTLDDQLVISYRTLEARQRALRIVAARHRGGVASGLDLRQAEILVENARQVIADLELQRSLAENSLSILVGRNPGPIARAGAFVQRTLPPELPAGLPSALVERRPDILAASDTLRATDLDVDAARKAYLPTISLTGLVGFVSPELRDILRGSRFAWSATPAISVPIFTGGLLEANVEGAEASRRLALEQYRKAVRDAFREVEDALVSYQRDREQREVLARNVALNRERLRLTDLRYLNGFSSYFEVTVAQQDLFEAELALSRITSAAYAAVIQLYRALGGGLAEGSVTLSSTQRTP